MGMERRRSSKCIRKQDNIDTMSSLSYSGKHNGVEGKDASSDASGKSSGGGGKSIKAMWKRFAFKATKTKSGTSSLPTSEYSTQNTSEEGQPADIQVIQDGVLDPAETDLSNADPVYALLRCAATIRKNSSIDDSSGVSSMRSRQNTASFDISNSSRCSSPATGETSSKSRRKLQLLQQGRGWSADIDESLADPHEESFNNQYVILYDFYKREPGDLPLRAGNRVSVKEKDPTGWWLAEFNGDSGYFPARYALPLMPRQPVLQVMRPFHSHFNGKEVHLLRDQVVLQCGPGDNDDMITIETDNIQTGTVQRLQCPLAYLCHI